MLNGAANDFVKLLCQDRGALAFRPGLAPLPSLSCLSKQSSSLALKYALAGTGFDNMVVVCERLCQIAFVIVTTIKLLHLNILLRLFRSLHCIQTGGAEAGFLKIRRMCRITYDIIMSKVIL
jgi:hypothetical protein